MLNKKEYMKIYNLKNKKRLKIQRKKHYLLNREKILKKIKKYNKKHRVKILKYLKQYNFLRKDKSKKYRLDHKKEIRKRMKVYQKSLKGIYRVIKNSAYKKHLKLLSFNLFSKWYNKQKRKCYYCDRTENNIKKDSYFNRVSRLTIDRKNNNKGYILDNIVLACMPCNIIKSNFFTEKEMKVLGKTIKKLLKKRGIK